jgi:heterodisulfide reductase subunit A
MHQPTFRQTVEELGLNPYLVEMANIREQCSWVHSGRREATEKAKRLVASAVARAARLESLLPREVSVTPGAVVIGGGIAGMTAALDVADAGFQVYLVEQSDRLGGRAASLGRTFPMLEPVAGFLGPLIARVKEHPNVTTLLDTEVTALEGCVGSFRVVVTGNQKGGHAARELQTGWLVVATGCDVFDPRRMPELGYRDYANVITSLEMERRLALEDLSFDGSSPKKIAFVQCVGSRDALAGNSYCSRVCCMVTAKQSRLARELLPEAEVTVFHSDMRAIGNGAEEFYDEALAKGVRYRRAAVSEIYRSRQADRRHRVILAGEDTLQGRAFELEADLVVLAVGIEPRSDATNLASVLKLPRSADGFLLELHPKLGPVDTAVDGVSLAGCCQGPKDITDTISQAKAAASSALVPLIRGTLPAEAVTAVVEEELCTGCGMCVDVCPFDAATLDPLWETCRINDVLCKGCGTCPATCPSKAIRLHHFTPEQVLAQVDALVG